MGSAVDSDRCAAMHRIAALGQQEFEQTGSPVPAEGPEAALQDWWVALKFWFNCSFMRYRTDEASCAIRDRALPALLRVLGDGVRPQLDRLRLAHRQGWLRWNGSASEPSPVLAALISAGGIPVPDREMVLSSLDFAAQLPDANMVTWAVSQVRRGSLPAANERLQSIRYVGPKIASMFLREIVSAYELSDHVGPQGYALLFSTRGLTACALASACGAGGAREMNSRRRRSPWRRVSPVG